MIGGGSMAGVYLMSMAAAIAGVPFVLAFDPVTEAGRISQLGISGVLALVACAAAYLFMQERKQRADAEREHRQHIQQLTEQYASSLKEYADGCRDTFLTVAESCSRAMGENSALLSQVVTHLDNAQNENSTHRR